MYTIIIDCQDFCLEHGVYIVNDKNKTVEHIEHLPTNKLANYISQIENINSVLLQGIPDYCLGVKEQLEKTLALEYANKNIKIEVIK